MILRNIHARQYTGSIQANFTWIWLFIFWYWKPKSTLWLRKWKCCEQKTPMLKREKSEERGEWVKEICTCGHITRWIYENDASQIRCMKWNALINTLTHSEFWINYPWLCPFICKLNQYLAYIFLVWHVSQNYCQCSLHIHVSSTSHQKLITFRRGVVFFSVDGNVYIHVIISVNCFIVIWILTDLPIFFVCQYQCNAISLWITTKQKRRKKNSSNRWFVCFCTLLKKENWTVKVLR